MIKKYPLWQTFQINKCIISLNNSQWRRLMSSHSESQSEKFINVNLNKPTIGRTVAEQECLYIQQPDMPENPKLLKVSVLGVPNSGKSTLVNRLMNRRVSAVSSKINTTRNRLTAVLTDQDSQLIILDTPGLVSLKKKNKFNLDRSMIVDPHSSLWESDLVCVVHDVSDEYSQNRIDKEVLKCLFAHPEKEAILVLNKIDKIKNKKSLLEMVVNLTGGYMAGKQFVSKEAQRHKRRLIPNVLSDMDFERLFVKTAERMNIQIEDKSKKNKEVLKLLDELKACEEHLIKNLASINVNNDSTNNQEQNSQQNETQLGINKNSLISAEKRMSLEKLKSDYVSQKLTLSSTDNVNKDFNLVQSVINDSSNSPLDGQQQPQRLIRTIEDISPFDFKQDLLKTTDWHLYYKKLSTLGLFVREKTYWPYFNQVFMISARQNDGVDDLKRYLFSRAKPSDWVFSRNMLTDQMPQEIAEMCVREKLLEHLPDEVPYELSLQTDFWEVDENDCLNVVINIIPGQKWRKKRHLSVLFQNKGQYLKVISTEAIQEMMNSFQCEVKLRLNVVTE